MCSVGSTVCSTAEAMEHLDRTGERFSRHGAKRYLDQMLAKKEILKACGRLAGQPGSEGLTDPKSAGRDALRPGGPRRREGWLIRPASA